VMQVRFSPSRLPVLTKWTADMIASAGEGEFEVSLDLGLTRSQVRVTGGLLLLPGGEEIPLEKMKELEEGEVYFVRGGRIFRAAFFAGGRYYRLLAVRPDSAPTLEISGVRMHRTEEITPWRDAELKVRCVRPFPGSSVLDVGTGLGYTAIWSLSLGSSSVVTIERDRNVIKMAEVNPWSERLSDARVRILLGDASEVIEEFGDASFDRVINDPPRFALAGELYSGDFYKEIFRVLRPGGWLYHYVGDPGRRRRKDMPAGVIRRLKECGFERVRRSAVGVLARKPPEV
jgi:predicted methyltransferase